MNRNKMSYNCIFLLNILYTNNAPFIQEILQTNLKVLSKQINNLKEAKLTENLYYL